jgi:hypothetical protein
VASFGKGRPQKSGKWKRPQVHSSPQISDLGMPGDPPLAKHSLELTREIALMSLHFHMSAFLALLRSLPHGGTVYA